ncbi:hypothetical protein [Haladaptatus sp. CMSO5]|uniref:hypothetical protein n=1 Tax=Haladaptatus sp. CMSO5 TaxID=3120514 RepID=UPI002FCDE8D7
MPETVDQKFSELQRRRAYIADRIVDDEVPTPDKVFNPLLADFDALLDEIQYDIETLTGLSDGTDDFYEQICNDLWDAHSKLQKVEKIISYYELHTVQETDSTAIFDNVRTVVDELCHPLNINFDIIPIRWNQTALVRIVPTSVYGLWLPRNISTETFTEFAPLIGHEIGHVTMDYREYYMPDTVNQERKRIASEFDNREETVADALVDWYEELYCDTIGTLTFGPAYAVSLTRRLFSDNPYKLAYSIATEHQHPPDALRYRHVMNILDDEFPADVHRLAHEQTETFRQHLEQLSSKKTHAYADWWNDRFLDAIHDDANQFVASDTHQLATALTESDADMPDTIAMRARVNRALLEMA